MVTDSRSLPTLAGPGEPAPGDSVLDIVRHHASLLPHAPALLVPGSPLVSYRALVSAVEETCAELRNLGLGRADRVAVVPPEGPAGVVVLLSLLETAVCCPVNPAFSGSECQALLKVMNPRAVLVPSGMARSLRDAADQCRTAIVETSVPTPGAAVRPRLSGVPLPPGGDPGEHKGDALLLRTSGTTAEGKIVALTRDNVVAAARATVRAYRLGPQDRRLNVMPLFHVQGLVGSMIASLVAGSSVVCLPSFDPAQTLRCLAEYEVTWFSASPTMHRKLLDLRPGPLPRLRFVRCGSSALPTGLREELEAAYGVPVVESYGMSEAHQIASTPLSPAPAVGGMVPTGSRIGVLLGGAADGRITTVPGSAGELVVSGPNVARGYLWPTEADGGGFVDGWLRTGDHGVLQADGSVSITGRIKELIDRGGEKIAPGEVEEALLSHPAVAEAAAFGIADPVYTEQVAAAVVLREGAQAAQRELIAHAGERLAAFKVPRRITVRGELPLNATGKVSRRTLAEEWAASPPQETPDAAAAPRTALQAALAGLWGYALGVGTVGVDEDFFALGGDSLSAVSLLSTVETVLGVRLSPLALFDTVNTVEAMAEAVLALRGEADGPAK